MNHTTITFNGDHYLATETDPVTFGRDIGCTICLDPEDTGISRRAGTVRWENGIWWLVNDSRSRPLIVSDDRAPRNVLPRQRRHPLDVVTRVIVDGRPNQHVDGRRNQHILIVTPQGNSDAHLSDGEPPGPPTVSGLNVRLSDDDRQALAALLENYMLNPSRIESIRSYTGAAKRIGPYHTPAQVRRRVEHLRERLSKAGVAEVKGPNAMQHLAEYVIHSGQLTFDDVRRLLPPP
ncbi:FHA domain-containing protein [Actinomadura rubrisoli]|uniref:FHA domain-containing protein n=1 Tax=Actinomadura rubrisoli TaxID=2530368 RepID=A0A4R5CAB3_9ACTN|nr:FHA domain-containing protein [Actinomadura rubrisoli]TDD95130.1 hypothetical protein E1298_05660 [Actinomadura rubrisoli]